MYIKMQVWASIPNAAPIELPTGFKYFQNVTPLSFIPNALPMLLVRTHTEIKICDPSWKKKLAPKRWADNFPCQAAPEFVLDHSCAWMPSTYQYIHTENPVPLKKNFCEHFSYIRKSFVLLLFSVWWHKVHLATSKVISIWWRGWKLTHSVVEHMKGSPHFTEPQLLFHANAILAKITSDYGSHLNNLCYSVWRRGKYQKIELKLRMTWKTK